PGGIGGVAGIVGRGGVGGVAGMRGRGGAGPGPECYTSPVPLCGTLCGNGVIDTCMRQVALSCPTLMFSEECDGADFGPDNCVNRGYASGTLLCNADCQY